MNREKLPDELTSEKKNQSGPTSALDYLHIIKCALLTHIYPQHWHMTQLTHVYIEIGVLSDGSLGHGFTTFNQSMAVQYLGH